MCSHPINNLVLDQHEGTTVCMTCSRVVDELMFGSATHQIEARSNELEMHSDELHELLDLCHNQNIPRCILQSVADHLAKNNRSRIDAVKPTFAFFLYKELVQFGWDIDMDTIAQWLGIDSAKSIWKIHAQCNTVMEFEPDYFYGPFASTMGISYNQLENLKKYGLEIKYRLRNFSFTPRNVAAAIVHLYLDHYQQNSTTRSVGVTCKKLCVSSSSMQKFLKILSQSSTDLKN